MKAVTEKDSFINLNLDPALPSQRKKNVIPKEFYDPDNGESLINFSFEIIEQVKDYCCAIKPNLQYFLGNSKILERILKKIHHEGMLALLDHKLSDIGSSNASALFWISKMGFDAFTFSPLAGNLKETVENAHEKQMGVFVLTLMSNPEAERIFINGKVEGCPLYIDIANSVRNTSADGCVVGLTGFVKTEYIDNIQKIVGNKTVFLLQGIGPQGGEIQKIENVNKPLISLGRTVIYSDNPKKTIKQYYDKLKPLIKSKIKAAY
jgi:orotidine-5'-phosphate decarboxylase